MPTFRKLNGGDCKRVEGVGAPKSTSADTIDKLNEGINAGLANPQIKAHLANLGSVPTPMWPAAFEKFIADDTEKWAKVIKFAKIKPQ